MCFGNFCVWSRIIEMSLGLAQTGVGVWSENFKIRNERYGSLLPARSAGALLRMSTKKQTADPTRRDPTRPPSHLLWKLTTCNEIPYLKISYSRRTSAKLRRALLIWIFFLFLAKILLEILTKNYWVKFWPDPTRHPLASNLKIDIFYETCDFAACSLF